MVILEIWIPEALIVFFLVVPLFRPFIKALVPLDGLAWLPLIALGITIGIFPAYGFRPECLPILVFAFIYCTANLFRPKDSFRDRGAFSTLCAFVLLGAVTFTMFAFSSKVVALPEFREPESSEAVLVTELKTTEWITSPAGIYNRDYSLRVYGDIHSSRPLIFLVPPEIGSVDSVNIICTELQKKDFTVVSYTYKDNDPLKRRSFSNKQLRYWRIFRRAADFASLNEQGKTLETDRRAEIEFLLSRLPSVLENKSMPPILLAGYSAGGSALAYLAGEESFIARYHNVLGVAAIESRLWSSYLPEPPAVSPAFASNIPVGEKVSLRQWAYEGFWFVVNHLNKGLHNILPQRVSRSGHLPNVGGLPVLYLVSGKALDPRGQKPYQAVFDSIRLSPGPVAFAALEGAGPLDYQDYPLTHPIYSFLLPGLKDTVKSAEPLARDPVGDTVSIIANYASFLMGQNVSRETFTISGSLYVESKGLPDFGLIPQETAD